MISAMTPQPAGSPEVQADHRGRLRSGIEARKERARALGWRKQLTYRVHYLVVLSLVGLLRLFDVDHASKLGGWIGRRFLYRRVNTEQVRRTVRIGLPSATDEQVAAVVREMSDNVVRVVAETAHLKAFTGVGNPRLEVRGQAHFEEARAGGRGVLFVMGHFANWEVAAIPLRQMGIDGVFSVMPPSNPHVFGWLARLRTSVGFSEQANAGEGVYRAFRRALKEGRSAIVLADQRLLNGIRAPFFGREVMTNVIPARLARTLGVVVIPLAVRRSRPGTAYFVVEFMPALEFRSTGHTAGDEREFTARMNAFYESEILISPGQWLWLDPRWEEY